MRKLIAVLCTLALLFALTTAHAEPASVNYALHAGVPQAVYSAEIVVPYTQNCYVHVQVIQQQSNGGTTTSVISPVAFTVEYRVKVYRNSDGNYIGASLIEDDGYPKIRLVNTSIYDLGVSVEQVSYPSLINSQCTGNSYTITVAGGQVNVTYNSVIYVNAGGVQSDADSTTEARVYYAVITGP